MGLWSINQEFIFDYYRNLLCTLMIYNLLCTLMIYNSLKMDN